MLIMNITKEEIFLKMKGVHVQPGQQIFVTPKEYNKLGPVLKLHFMVTMTNCPFKELEQEVIGEKIEEDDS